MFQQLFNFGYQRTALQALGWYLFFALVGMLLGAFAATAGIQLGLIHSPGSDFSSGIRAGALVAPVVPVVVGGLLLWSKQFNPANVLIALVAVIVSFYLGWFGAGIPLAYLTTRPPR